MDGGRVDGNFIAGTAGGDGGSKADGAGDVEMSVIPIGGAAFPGGSAQGNGGGASSGNLHEIKVSDVSLEGEGEATNGIKVQRTAEEMAAQCPPGSSTGVKKMFEDVRYYDEKCDNQVGRPLPAACICEITATHRVGAGYFFATRRKGGKWAEVLDDFAPPPAVDVQNEDKSSCAISLPLLSHLDPSPHGSPPLVKDLITPKPT